MSRNVQKNGHLFSRKFLETKNMLLIQRIKCVMINDKVVGYKLYCFQNTMKNGTKWKPKNMLLIRRIKCVIINEKVSVNKFYYFQTIIKNGTKWKPKIKDALVY